MKEELENKLTDMQYYVTQENGQSRHSTMNMIAILKKEFM